MSMSWQRDAEGEGPDTVAAVRAADRAAVWEEGRRAGVNHERRMWQWQAGRTSRAVHGLKERPERPVNPYEVQT